MNSVSAWLNRLKEFWQQSTPAMRWGAGGGAALLLTAGLMTWWLNRPSWVVLVRDLEPKEAAAVVAKLNELKVPNRPVGDGYTIQVRETDLYTARLALAEADLAQPGPDGIGFEWFDSPQFGATEFDRKVNYLRGLQTELARALMRMEDVAYANVKLAIPEETVFIREDKPVTAAVLIRTERGQMLPPDRVLAIVQFVSRSVQGLLPENVTVVDDQGRLLSNGATEALMASLNGDQDVDTLRLQEEMRTKYERNVQSLLEPLFGPGNVVAKVHLELNRESSRTESTTYGPNVVRSQQTLIESRAATAAADGNRPGDAALPPTYQAITENTGAGEEYRNQVTTTYEVSEETKVTISPAGDFKRVTVGVVVNRDDLTPEQIATIKETVAGATGARPEDISVTAMRFDRAAALEPFADDQPSWLSNPANVIAMTLGGIAVLLMMGFFISRRRQGESEPVEELALETPIPAGDLLAEAMGRTVDITVADEDEGEDEDSTLEEPDSTTPIERIPSEQEEQEQPVLRDLVEEGIRQMIEEDPAAVAAQISNWIKS